jgi:uncharacterized membrane protein YraQ (UPF0718 family)
MEHTEQDCCEGHEHTGKKPWYRNPLFLLAVLTAALLAASFVLPVLFSFRKYFLDYLRMIAGPIGLGFLLGGLIDYYVPKTYISKVLAGHNKSTVFTAAALGFLMSACSHGIIALAMEIHKKGASGPAVISFLLASPWANLPITFLLVGFFGWKGLLIIGAALLISILTGLLFQILDQKGWIEKNKNSIEVGPDFSIRLDIQKRWKNYRFTGGQLRNDFAGIGKGVSELAEMVLGWLLIGILLASLTAAFVPASFFQKFLGPTLSGLALTLILAAVFEVCSEGTSPLAFEIYKQTGALGNAFAFLMGGVITDYTEIGLVWTHLGKKTALWMMAVTIPQVLVAGWLFNHFFD